MLTPESRRAKFPGIDRMVYLNTAAEGIPPTDVQDALNEYFRDKQLGMDGRGPHFAALEEAKSLVASFYGLSSDETAICSCSSEAYNLAAMALQLKSGDEVVINDLDFPAGATPWLQPSCPATVRIWKSRGGVLHLDDLAALLNGRTRLVAVSLVSFFNGFRLSIPDVLRCVRAGSEALLSVDVTQALGRIPLELSGVDLIVSSTHKWILASHGGGWWEFQMPGLANGLSRREGGTTCRMHSGRIVLNKLSANPGQRALPSGCRTFRRSMRYVRG